jgi:DNA-binding beta-propeller fold protein YncE
MTLLTTSLSVAAGAQSIKTLINFPEPVAGIAVDPVRSVVYAVVPNVDGESTDNLAVIDGNKDVFLKDIAVPSGSLFVAVDAFTNRVFVAGCNFNLVPAPCSVTVIDGKKDTILSTIPITQTPGFGLTGIVVNPLTCQVFVANGSDNVVNIINGYTAKLAGSIDLKGNSPFAIAINPILGLIYLPFGSNETGVASVFTKKLLGEITYGADTVGVAVNFLNGNVYINDSEFGPSSTGVFTLAGKPLASVPVDDSPLGVDVDPLSKLVFVASTALDTIDVIDATSNTLKTTVAGVPANYVAVNYLASKVYVSGRTGVTVLNEK